MSPEQRGVSGRQTLGSVRKSIEQGRALCWVKCPKTGSVVPAERCASCPSAAAVRRDEEGRYRQVVCADGEPAGLDDELGVVHLRRARTDEVMTRQVPCVRQSVPLDELVRLFLGSCLKCLPVVDDNDVVVGMVEEGDVHLDLHVRGHSERTAGDVMVLVAAEIQEDSPITLAAATLLAANATCLPVLSCNGVVVGMIHVRDVMRWLALGDGYVIGATSG